MATIVYIGLRKTTLQLLQNHVHVQDVLFKEVTADRFNGVCKLLQNYHVLLIGEEVESPIRFAQEAYSHDKSISILLLNDNSNFGKIKQALQFSPFIGPTVQPVSTGTGERMAPIIEDAMQRTAQRRSFAQLKAQSLSVQRFAPNVLEKVRSDFTTKVLEEAPIGVMLVSGAGNIFSINNYALGLFNRSERDVLGIPVAALFPEQVQADVKVFLQDGFLNESKRVFKVQINGDKLYLELSVAPIDTKASSDYKLLILNNITTTIEAQQRTQAHLEELEKLNTNLARVNADLDTFVYTASHDLKSPILNIEGLVSSLEQELGAAQQASVATELEHIKRSIKRFKQTVEELTEVSRLQRSFEQEALLVNMPELLEEVKQLLDREISETGTVVETDLKSTAIFFPKRNLTSILYNLISNGIKYSSPDRKPIIRVKTWCDQGDFCITVQDNGLGIPEAKLSQVFQLFKRMHSHVQGSGVGLYIVKRIIDNNGGEITIKSEEGIGTEFFIRLRGCAVA